LLHVFELRLRLKFAHLFLFSAGKDSTFFTHRSNHSGRSTANQTNDDHSPTTHHITNPSPPLRLPSSFPVLAARPSLALLVSAFLFFIASLS
jgi:hypothetical protein